MDKENQIYWHYTSAESAFKILSSNSPELYISNYRHMNDSREGRAYRKVAKEKLQDNRYGAWYSDFCRCIDSESSRRNPFIFSLSSDRDSLSQWRAYGNVAIGFDIDTEKMKAHTDHQAKLLDCVYTKANIRPILNSVGLQNWVSFKNRHNFSEAQHHLALQIDALDAKKSRGELITSSTQKSIDDLTRQLGGSPSVAKKTIGQILGGVDPKEYKSNRELFLQKPLSKLGCELFRIKHKGFADEKEQRLYIESSENNFILGKYGPKPIVKLAISGSKSYIKVKYIKVGPVADKSLMRDSWERWVGSIESLRRVKVLKSKIPFRGLREAL